MSWIYLFIFFFCSIVRTGAIPAVDCSGHGSVLMQVMLAIARRIIGVNIASTIVHATATANVTQLVNVFAFRASLANHAALSAQKKLRAIITENALLTDCHASALTIILDLLVHLICF